tara:strand:- start:181 stop:906 length:726 start_codon:yes stop_codon:yes gene_type:complete
MNKNLKIFLGISYLLILFAFLYLIFIYIDLNRLGDFSYYKEIQIDLGKYVSANLVINLVYFFFFAIIWVALLGFGSPILIISGILFGQWVGTLISVISISLGAVLLYTIGIFFFSDLVKTLLEKKFKGYIELFQKNEFFYFFIYRLTGGLGVPFALQNLLPVLFDMKKTNYFLASLFGFIPSMFVMNTIGAGLNTYLAQAQTFSIISLLLTKEIFLPLTLFLILMIFSLIMKKKFFNDRNK